MEKIIRNNWRQIAKGQFHSSILNRDKHPEGLDISRFSFKSAGEIELNPLDGHIVTILNGMVLLKIDSFSNLLKLESFIHCYIPPHENAILKASENTELIHVAGPKKQARGKSLIVRDEQFLRATADTDRFLRWVLTPQYLSRRIFLYNDKILVSKNNMPVSWFRTTMFDVKGLPPNDDGISVFKMSYDNQTEPNVCYDVVGKSQVRMAKHPYKEKGQEWDDWQLLDNNTTYYLNEDENGSDVEWHTNPETGERFSKRNKHEVYIPEGGHVSLCCLFDPAPTGTEKHLPGKYSSYQHVSKIIGTEMYQQHLKTLTVIDKMVDKLSILKAQELPGKTNTDPIWDRYHTGLKNQMKLESHLIQQLRKENQDRHTVVTRWITK